MARTSSKFSANVSPVEFPFQLFDEQKEVRIYNRGFLPHWRQAGCTYFVTFRTADSIPRGVYRQWKYERDTWLKARNIDPESNDWHQKGVGLPDDDQKNFQRAFAAKLFSELDKCHGACVLEDLKLASTVADSILYFHDERMLVGNFVIMPNHIHALITPINGFELEDLLHSIKSFTANKINKQLNREGEFWMPESHDHIVRDGEELLRIQNYIECNPDKAGLDAKNLIVYQVKYNES